MVQHFITQKRQPHHKPREIRITRPNPRMDPFLVPDAAAVVAVARAIAGVAAEEVVGTVVESAVAV